MSGESKVVEQNVSDKDLLIGNLVFENLGMWPEHPSERYTEIEGVSIYYKEYEKVCNELGWEMVGFISEPVSLKLPVLLKDGDIQRLEEYLNEYDLSVSTESAVETAIREIKEKYKEEITVKKIEKLLNDNNCRSNSDVAKIIYKEVFEEEL